jgi:hypothetical protein
MSAGKNLYVSIPMAVLKQLWVDGTGAGLGLYAALTSLVTVEVPDPRSSNKKFGVVLGGTPLTNETLADRIGCSLLRLRYEKRILVSQGLLIQKQDQHGFRLVVTESVKWLSKRQANVHPKYSWIMKPLDSTRTGQRELNPHSEGEAMPQSERLKDEAIPQQIEVLPHSLEVTPHPDAVIPQPGDSGNNKIKDLTQGKAERKAKTKGEEKAKASGASKNAAPTSSHSLSSGGQENGHKTPQPGRQPQGPTEAEAKRLCRLIVAHANEKFDITFTASNTRDLLAGIRETPVAPDAAWLFAVDELVDQLEHADNDGFARSQAASRLAATLPTKFVPVKIHPDNFNEKPTCVIDHYYECKAQPFLMEEEDAAGEEVAEDLLGKSRGCEPSNPAALARYVLREQIAEMPPGKEKEEAKARLAQLRAEALDKSPPTTAGPPQLLNEPSSALA